MTRTQTIALIGALLSVTFASFSSLAGSYPELEKLIKDKQYTAAFETAEKMNEKEAGDPDFDLLYGQAAREVGKPELAIFALERVLMKDPKNGRGLYEKARTQMALKDYTAARKSAAAAIASSKSATVKRNANKLLESIEKVSPKSSKPTLKVNGQATVGYNSNTNASPVELEERYKDNPGPPKPSGYANISATATLTKNLSKRDKITFSIGANNRFNFSSDQRDYNVLSTKFGFETPLSILQIKIPFNLDVNLVRFEPTRISVASGLELGKSWTPMHFTSLSALFKATGSTDTKNNQRLLELAGDYRGNYLSNRLVFSGRAFYNPVLGAGNDTAVGQGVNNSLGGQVKLAWEFLKSHFAKGDFKLSYLDFWHVPAGTPARQDVVFVSNIGYDWKISSNFTLGPSYMFVYNKSNITRSTYLRHQVQLGLTVNF